MVSLEIMFFSTVAMVTPFLFAKGVVLRVERGVLVD
jgi:hypothetical protein